MPCYSGGISELTRNLYNTLLHYNFAEERLVPVLPILDLIIRGAVSFPASILLSAISLKRKVSSCGGEGDLQLIVAKKARSRMRQNPTNHLPNRLSRQASVALCIPHGCKIRD
jgi:hypothetical protein